MQEKAEGIASALHGQLLTAAIVGLLLVPISHHLLMKPSSGSRAPSRLTC